MQLAVDIGGTFTDVFLYEPKTGLISMVKVSSNSKDPSVAFLEGFKRVMDLTKRKAQDVQRVVHATTIVTNALLEGRTAAVGLLVTEGFADILEIGRQVRPSLYDLGKDRLPPLVPRDMIVSIDERMDADGKVLKSPDRSKVLHVVRKLRRKGAKTLAVVFLFSFLNPEHEEEVLHTAGAYYSEEDVFLSSKVSPEFREYERASTTVISAAVAPVVIAYLKKIQSKIKDEGAIRAGLDIMHSGGGILSAVQAAARPHCLVESGPAAGILAAASLANELNIEKVIAFDMGGTSAKAGIVLEGVPQFTQSYEVGGGLHTAGARGSGYPVQFPMIDIAECGAGAGSIARIDSGGHLKVGPESAGSNPGPACYGRGGEFPTVTDAFVVLGYLDEDSFLGGAMKLDVDASKKSIGEKIGRPLSIDVRSAAQGILKTTLANTLKILRLISISRGFDPRFFSMMAYGGAGPLVAAYLAEELGICRVVIPLFPGLFSACGLILADKAVDFVQTVLHVMDSETKKRLKHDMMKLREKAKKWCLSAGENSVGWKFMFSADVRYKRQNYELNIPFRKEKSGHFDINNIEENFHCCHKRAYGYADLNALVQVVNIRLRIIKKAEKLSFSSMFRPSETKKEKQKKRFLWLPSKKKGEGRLEKVLCPFLNRDDLPKTGKVKGPAVIQENNSTVFLPRDWALRGASTGCLFLEKLKT